MATWRKEQCAALADRVEAARSGNRNLDREIGLALGLLHLDENGRLYEISRADGHRVYGGQGDDIITPELTGSVDVGLRVAQRLVPGCFGDVDVFPPSGDNLCGARLFPPAENNGRNFAGEAETPALALTAALLRLYGETAPC